MKVKTILAGICLILTAACSQPVNETGNAVIENIMARRSIRKYKAETVDREILTKIMECGINAPNGQNKQSWEVRIVDNELCRPLVEKLNFSDGYEFCLCVGLGYADEAPEAKPRDMGKVAFVD